jgi:hypothetical protein
MSQTGKGLDIFGRGERGTRYQLIACEVAYREVCFAAAVSRNIIDLKFLTQGLHDLESRSMAEHVQEAVDGVPAGRYRAILLGFGLCNCGLAGVRARGIPLVLPRAHDCITLFMGSKEAYQRDFESNKGTYYLTTGWLERDKDNLEDTMGREDNMLRKMGLDKTCEEYAAQYGEEYARMIMATLTGLDHYQRMTHIEMGLAPEAEQRAIEHAKAEAARRGWTHETIKGRMDLFLGLVNGEWDETKYLVVRPGESIQQAYDERIVKAVAE